MTHFTAFYKCFVKFFSFCGWWRCTIMVREREERISYWTCLSTFGHIGDDDPFIPIDSYKELFSNIKLIMYSLLSLFVNWLMKRKTGEQNRLIVQVIYSGLCSKRTTRVQGFPVCHMTSTLSFSVFPSTNRLKTWKILLNFNNKSYTFWNGQNITKYRMWMKFYDG